MTDAERPGSASDAPPAGTGPGARTGPDAVAESAGGRPLAAIAGGEPGDRMTRRTSLALAVLAGLLGIALVAAAPSIVKAISGASGPGPAPTVEALTGAREPTSAESARSPGEPAEPSASATPSGKASPSRRPSPDPTPTPDGQATQDPDPGAGTDPGASDPGQDDQDGQGTGDAEPDPEKEQAEEEPDPRPVNDTRACDDCTYQGFSGAQVELRPKWRIVGGVVEMAVDWRKADVGYSFDVVLEDAAGGVVDRVRYTGNTPDATGSTPWYPADGGSPGASYRVAVGNPLPDSGFFYYETPYPASPPFTY